MTLDMPLGPTLYKQRTLTVTTTTALVTLVRKRVCSAMAALQCRSAKNTAVSVCLRQLQGLFTA
jgi:hypothetical protein